MGRRRLIGMYRNAFKLDRSLTFERHYRLAVAKIEKDFKPKKGVFRRETLFWQGYEKYKPKPGAYTP